MLLADNANQYLDQEKPWIMIKNEEKKDEVQKVCTNALNMFLKLTIMLKPVMPDVASNVESFMNSHMILFGLVRMGRHISQLNMQWH